MSEIDPTMSTVMLFILTSSVVSPFLAMLVNQPTWSKQVRQAIAALIAILVAIVTVLLTGGFESLAQGATSILLVLGLSTVAYDAIWKPSGAAGKIESATSPRVIDGTARDITSRPSE